MIKRLYSERVDLIEKSREAMLSAVQIFNNPLTTFKSESYIVLAMIAWTYLLHAYYRGKKIEYKYFKGSGQSKRYLRNFDGSVKFWDLRECISKNVCPLDVNTINNLNFLIGLRNQVEHRKVDDLDSFLSARYQACALNYNYYLKLLHGERYSLDSNLALSLQFSELDYVQSKIIKDKEKLIPKEITSYIAGFDQKLTRREYGSERYAYRLLFVKTTANRVGQADKVIEFVDPKSKLAKYVSKERWVKEVKKRVPMLVRQVIYELKNRGITIGKSEHTILWRKYDGKNPSRGYGAMVGGAWLWYQDWIDFLTEQLKK
jgi:hypothetical protein